MRDFIAIASIAACLASTGCATRSATIGHTVLAGLSLGGGALALSHDCGDQGHSECDEVGPQVMGGLLVTTGIVFGLAALISYSLEPNDEPAPPR
jgi:hypothetical protein